MIVPSNDFVERMVKADMLIPLDHAQIPNIKNVDPSFINVAYDPGRKYSLPYTWLVLGIGYRKSKVKGKPDSWKVIFDSADYKGRIALLSEAGDMFRLYGKYLGKSVNGLTPEDIKVIEAMMIKQKPNVKAFHEDNGQDLLLSGEVDLVLEYNGDIAQIMAEDDDIDFVLPKEGSQLNSDNMCIPKGAPHPKNAHALINYLLDAEVGKKITETIKYPTPNDAVKALMPAGSAVIFLGNLVHRGGPDGLLWAQLAGVARAAARQGERQRRHRAVRRGTGKPARVVDAGGHLARPQHGQRGFGLVQADASGFLRQRITLGLAQLRALSVAEPLGSRTTLHRLVRSALR
mgnify:CR=1 FL=1